MQSPGVKLPANRQTPQLLHQVDFSTAVAPPGHCPACIVARHERFVCLLIQCRLQHKLLHADTNATICGTGFTSLLLCLLLSPCIHVRVEKHTCTNCVSRISTLQIIPAIIIA